LGLTIVARDLPTSPTATEIGALSVRGRTPGREDTSLSVGAGTMWKAAREEMREIVWLVLVIGSLSALAAFSVAALAV
jgi:hypothetical protein